MVVIPEEEDPCSIVNLTEDAKCLQCYSGPEKEIVKVWAMAQLLSQLGGGDLTDIDALIDAVVCYKCEPPLTLDGFEAAIWINSAVDAGMAPVTKDELSTALNCWKCLDPVTVKAAYTLLLCRIAQLQTPPLIL